MLAAARARRPRVTRVRLVVLILQDLGKHTTPVLAQEESHRTGGNLIAHEIPRVAC